MSNQLVYGSLSDIAQRSGKSVAHTFLNIDALIMVDTSASMETEDCSGGRRRYDLACEQLIRLQREIPGKIGLISWNSDARFCPGGIPSSPYGGTDLANVLTFIQPADGTGIKLILISDGEPDNEDKALALAKKFKSQIETIYIGPEVGAGRDFLRRLAEAAGGRGVSQSVQDLGNLSKVVRGLLAA
jgi:hypothetical protein